MPDHTNLMGPIDPPFQWFGGKSEMAQWIIDQFPYHTTFVDVFGGAGSIILAKVPSPVEVYNDIDGELANFFSVCRDFPHELAVRLELTPYSRLEYWECVAAIQHRGHGDDSYFWPNSVERARQFATVARQSMANAVGKAWSRAVGHSRRGMSSSVSRWLHLPDAVVSVGQRFRTVQIEHLDWTKVLSDYDRPTTLFYLDPPYHPETCATGTYRFGMTAEDHTALLDALVKIEGAAVLSGYSHPMYEEKLAAWKRVERVVPCRSNVNTKGGTAARPTRTEVLWIKTAAAVAGEGGK